MSDPIGGGPPPPPPTEAGGLQQTATLDVDYLPRVPWEERARLGFVAAVVGNLRLFVTDPRAGFARAARTGDLLSPILWVMMIVAAVGVVDWLWSLALAAPVLPFLGRDAQLSPFVAALAGGAGIVGVVVGTVVSGVALFVGSGILHVILLILGGLSQSRCGFEGTVRAVAYATTAHVARVIPFIGGLIAMIWSVYLLIVGVAQIHRTGDGKAVAAVVIPFLLCCLCAFGAGFAAATLGIFGAAGLSELAR